MNLNEFYKAETDNLEGTDTALKEKLAKDLAQFVTGFRITDPKVRVITKIPEKESPVEFALGILLVKTDSECAEVNKKALLACEIGINVFKDKRIFIRPRIKSSIKGLDPLFLDRYVEFVRGHLNLMGKNVKVLMPKKPGQPIAQQVRNAMDTSQTGELR